MKRRLLTALAGLGLALLAAAPVVAQPATGQPVKFALCYDLSKSYGFVTPQISQAARDYATILNEKGGLEATRSRSSCRTTATSRSAASSATRSSSAKA